jgi:hypothetical protein
MPTGWAIILQRQGAGAGTGSWSSSLPRSAELVTAALGVLKSGAAYLPLDPELPPARLAAMVEAARPLAVIAGPSSKLPRTAGGGHWVDWVADRAAIQACPATRPDAPVTENHLAYAIFTSGTTGTPKLVGVEHRNISNLLAYAAAELFDPADWAWVPFSDAVSADSCVHQIFFTLAMGAGWCPSRSWGRWRLRRSCRALPGSARLRPRSNGCSTPSACRPRPACSESARKPPRPALLARLRAQPGIRELYNFTDRPRRPFTAPSPGCSNSPASPVVRPATWAASSAVRCAGTRCHVLDTRGEPVPLGVPGELVIAGLGVARGYLNDPGLTRERFIAEPGNPRRARLPRPATRPGGIPTASWSFSARRDTQIKIHGVRVELGGDRSAPACHSRGRAGGRDGRAHFRMMTGGWWRMWSCRRQRFSPARSATSSGNVSPTTVVPSTVVRLEALPLTLAGKIDRQRLPQPSVAPELGRRCPDGHGTPAGRHLVPGAAPVRRGRGG